MVRALVEAGWPVEALDLLDPQIPPDLGIPVRTFDNNRLDFTWACHRAALGGLLLI